MSIEATKGVTTGASALDRVTTIKATIAETDIATDLSKPWHVFPLIVKGDGEMVIPRVVLI